MSETMRGIVASVGALSVIVLCLACNESRSRVVRCPEGDLIQVNDEYSVVLLSSDFVESLFGPDWKSQELFYGFNRGIDETGQKAKMLADLYPMAKGSPILVLSGTDWEDMLCPIYSMTLRQQVLLSVDLKNGKIAVKRPLGAREGVPRVAPEGYLFFTEN